jgi:hypothetical protein
VVFPAGAGPGADYRREVRQPAQTRPFYPGAPLSPPNVSPAGLRFEYGRFWAAYRSWVAGSGAADVFKPEPSVLPPARNVGPGIAAPAAVPYVAPPADRTAAWRSWVAASGAADPWQPSPRTPRGAPNPGPFTFTGGADPTGAPFQPTSFPEAYVSWLLAGGPGDPLRPQPRRLTEPTFAGPAAGFTGGADPTGAVYLPAGVRLPFAAWATLPGGGETFRPAGAAPPGTSVADWLAGAPAAALVVEAVIRARMAAGAGVHAAATGLAAAGASPAGLVGARVARATIAGARAVARGIGGLRIRSGGGD